MLIYKFSRKIIFFNKNKRWKIFNKKGKFRNLKNDKIDYQGRGKYALENYIAFACLKFLRPDNIDKARNDFDIQEMPKSKLKMNEIF